MIFWDLRNGWHLVWDLLGFEHDYAYILQFVCLIFLWLLQSNSISPLRPIQVSDYDHGLNFVRKLNSWAMRGSQHFHLQCKWLLQIFECLSVSMYTHVPISNKNPGNGFLWIDNFNLRAIFSLFVYKEMCSSTSLSCSLCALYHNFKLCCNLSKALVVPPINYNPWWRTKGLNVHTICILYL